MDQSDKSKQEKSRVELMCEEYEKEELRRPDAVQNLRSLLSKLLRLLAEVPIVGGHRIVPVGGREYQCSLIRPNDAIPDALLLHVKSPDDRVRPALGCIFLVRGSIGDPESWVADLSGTYISGTSGTTAEDAPMHVLRAAIHHLWWWTTSPVELRVRGPVDSAK